MSKSTPYSELGGILSDGTDIDKYVSMYCGRYVGNQFKPAYEITKPSLEALIEQQKLEARIDEVEKAVSNFRWGQGTDDLTDRLAELKQKGK